MRYSKTKESEDFGIIFSDTKVFIAQNSEMHNLKIQISEINISRMKYSEFLTTSLRLLLLLLTAKKYIIESKIGFYYQ